METRLDGKGGDNFLFLALEVILKEKSACEPYTRYYSPSGGFSVLRKWVIWLKDTVSSGTSQVNYMSQVQICAVIVFWNDEN